MPWTADKLAAKRANSARISGKANAPTSGKQRATQLKQQRSTRRAEPADELMPADPSVALARVAQWRATRSEPSPEDAIDAVDADASLRTVLAGFEQLNAAFFANASAADVSELDEQPPLAAGGPDESAEADESHYDSWLAEQAALTAAMNSLYRPADDDVSTAAAKAADATQAAESAQER